MADRFYTKTTNLITFVAGERVSADKFNAMNKFYSRTFLEISRAIGSLYDLGFPNLENGESYLTYKWNPYQNTTDPTDPENREKGRPLDILNLARIIGPASNLNPKFLYRGQKQIQETIPAGVACYHTKLPIDSLVGNLEGWNFSSGELSSSNSYYVDLELSAIFFSEETSQPVDVTYFTDSFNYDGGPNYLYSEFNVIPDPNDTTSSLSIVDLNNSEYLITLPQVTSQQSNLFNLKDTDILTPNEPNNTVQLHLPKWMTHSNLFSEGDVIPGNSIYLKNRTTGVSYTGATYKYVNEYTIQMSGVELCLQEPDAHTFCIVCVGTDITTSIDDLRNKWFNHKHDGSFGEPRISVYDLSDRFKHLPAGGFYQPSSLNWNYNPHYLHRDGWVSNEDLRNGSNAMRGPLMMASSSFDGRDNIDVLGSDSFGIHFSSLNRYLKSISEHLVLFNSDGNVGVSSANQVDVTGEKVYLGASNIDIEASINASITANSYLSTRSLVSSFLSENDENEIRIDNDKVLINNSLEVSQFEPQISITPWNTNWEGLTQEIIPFKSEIYSLGALKKTKIRPFIASWRSPEALEVDNNFDPINTDHFERINGSLNGEYIYRALTGGWESSNPYPYEGDFSIYGSGFLTNSNTELTIYDGHLNNFYLIKLSEVKNSYYITPQSLGGPLSIILNRSINIEKHIKVPSQIQYPLDPGSLFDENNFLEELESTFYVKAEIIENNTGSEREPIGNVSLILDYSNDYYNSLNTSSIEEFKVTINGTEVAVVDKKVNLDITISNNIPFALKPNVIYKIKETYIGRKVWLEITG